MAKIDIYTAELVSLSSRLKKISATIADAESMAGSVQRNLDFQVAAKSGIDSGITKARSSLKRQNSKVTTLSKLTEVSNEEFMNADGQMDRKARNIVGKIVMPLINLAHTIQGIFAGGLISHYGMTGNLFLAGGSILGAAAVVPLTGIIRNLFGHHSGSGSSAPGAAGAGFSGAAGVAAGAGLGAVLGSVGTGTLGNTDAPAGSGTAASKPAGNKDTVVTKPAAAANTHSSKKNAESAGMKYFTQGKGYNKYWDGNVWKGADNKDYSYKASLSCGICCDAMVATHFGVDMTPGRLLEANGGNASWNGSGVTKEMAKYGITPGTVARKSDSPEAKLSALDACLADYQNDPAHHSPPMVSIYNKNNKDANHYVLVEGKDSNGNYIIIDPANNERTTLKVNSTGYGQAAADKKGYESVIKNVITWTKK